MDKKQLILLLIYVNYQLIVLLAIELLESIAKYIALHRIWLALKMIIS